MPDLLDRLHRPLPVWSAGMGAGLAGAALAAAVSEAGALGVLGLGGLGFRAATAVLESYAELSAAPYGANVILALTDGGNIEACFNARVPVLVLFWGDPQPFVGDAHRRGMFIVAQCGSAEEAVQAADAGVDAVIVQGLEAGGHNRARQPLAEIVAETVRELRPIPLIAAGGIANGADIARLLELGAGAVSMGTRFLASSESRAHDEYKRRVRDAGADDTVITDIFDRGWPQAPHRVLRNGTIAAWESAARPTPGGRPGANEDIGTIGPGDRRRAVQRYGITPPLDDFDGDLDAMPLYAGTSVAHIDDILPAAELVERLLAELRVATE